MLIHTVFFWMSPDATPADRDNLLRDCREILPQVETVRSCRAGVPANTPRDVVDNSYGVGLTITFDDAAGAATYDTHPKHQEFIERNKYSWSKVVVYDAVE